MIPDLKTKKSEVPQQQSAVSGRQSSSWDISNAPRNYLSLVLSQIGSAAFSFGAVWLITHRLGSEGYGGIVAIIAASQVAQVLVNWTGVAVVRFGVDEFIETEKIARTFWLRLIILLANLAIVLSVSGYWFPPLAGWLKLSSDSFWLVIVHFAVTTIWIHVQMSLQGAKMPRVQGVLQMIERLMIFATLLVLVAVGQFDGFRIMLCYIAAPAAMILIGLVRIRHYILSRFPIDGALVKKIFTYSLPLLPSSLVGYFGSSYLDAIFVSKFLSIRDLGIYSVATQMNGLAMQLPTLANGLLLPLFITLQKETENQRTFNYFRNVLPGLTLCWGLAVSALALVAYFMVPIIFGSEFAGATLPLWILLTASVAAIPVAIGYSALSNATSTTYISLTSAMLSALTNVGANFVLIPRYGIAGSAWATLLAYGVAMTVFMLLLRSSADMPISWTYFAIAPSIVGVAFFAFYANPAIGFAACLTTSFLVAYLFRDSIILMVSFLRNFRKV